MPQQRLTQNERLDREDARRRWLTFGIVVAILVSVIALSYLLLYYKQATALLEVFRAILYVSAGFGGSVIYARMRQ